MTDATIDPKPPAPRDAALIAASSSRRSPWRLRHLFVVTAALAIVFALLRDGSPMGVLAAGAVGVGLLAWNFPRRAWRWAYGFRVACVVAVVVASVGRATTIHVNDAIHGFEQRLALEASVAQVERQIEALERFARANGSPPTPTTSKDGVAWHSWRVDVLPYLVAPLPLGGYSLDEPWDSPTNRATWSATPWATRSRRLLLEDGDAIVLAVVDRDGRWPEAFRRRFETVEGDVEANEETREGGDPAETIVLVGLPETKIPWCEPRDLSPGTLTRELMTLGGEPVERLVVAFADGRVETIAVDELRERTPELFAPAARGKKR